MSDHRSHPDLLMARALRVCWHPPTSDRWPCTAEPEQAVESHPAAPDDEDQP